MARAAKDTVKTTNEKIAEVDNEIASHQKAISELKSHKKKLLLEKQLEDQEAVRRVAVESGLTAAELQELIDKHKKAK